MHAWARAGAGTAGAPLVLVLAFLAAHAHLADTYKQEGCVFPAKWSGRWFQSGVKQQIVIEGDRLSSKGKCLSSEGDKFLLVDEKGCYRCVVIHEKHPNVLQYKETFCHNNNVVNLCSLITGDALLYSMFRENASPVTCPLRGPFSFTYNRGHGYCNSPVSSIESCTEESRLLLNYQACPDVYGSESIGEELVCLATWKEGSLRYFVGKLHHYHATSDEDRYRCFVYEKTVTNSEGKQSDGVDYRVAQSGDATCNGLLSPSEGSRMMALKRLPLSWKCRFPLWVAGLGHWHTLDYSSTYSFHQKNATLRITAQQGADIKVHCTRVKESTANGNSVVLVADWQQLCTSRFVCLAFHRRGTHVVELQMGRHTEDAEDACRPENFNPATAPYITLVTSNPDPRDCPNSGKFSIAGLKFSQRSARSLLVDKIMSNQEEARNATRKVHKYNHRKHNKDNKYNHEREEMSDAERKKKKYQKFLEKIFEKEALKREQRLLKEKQSLHENITLNLQNKSSEVVTVSYETNHSVSLLETLSRSRRSSNKGDRSPCVSTEFTMLDIGCNSHENMEFSSSCDSKEFITAYSCHGGWTENGTSYLIITPLTRDSIGARRYCFIYRETAGQMIHFTRSSLSCDRSIRPGIDGGLVFNATTSGDCLQISSGVSGNKQDWLLLLTSVCFVYSALRCTSHRAVSR